MTGDEPTSSGMQRAIMARLQGPVNELPAILPLGVEVARTESIAIQLTYLELYTTSLVVRVDVRSAPGFRGPVMSPAEAVDGGLLTPNGGHHLVVTGADGVAVDSWTHRFPVRDQVGGVSAAPAEGEPSVGLQSDGGGSYERGYQSRLLYRISPRPAGPLLVQFEWTALGVGPSRTPIGRAELDALAATISTVWPLN